MSGYRIEVSPNNRAGCQDSVCKATGAKIIKGSLRFGTWVNIMEHGGWRWKHWGCVSGNQLESVRNSAATGDGYDWDTIDGYDEMGDHPDLQEKIRTAIEEGHIAAEDFNGDPEYNVLGQRAIRSRAAVKAAKDGEDPPAAEDKGTTPKKTPAKGTKRGRKTAAADSDEEEEEADETPVTKRAKKATPAKSEPATTPRPRGRPRKSAAKAEVDSDEADMVHAVPIPAPRGRGRPLKAAAAPKEEEPEDEEEEEQPKKKKAAPRGRPKKVREPDSDEEDMVHAVPIPPRGRGRPRKST